MFSFFFIRKILCRQEREVASCKPQYSMEYMESWERRIRGKSCCTSAEVVHILFSVFHVCFSPHIALITTKNCPL